MWKIYKVAQREYAETVKTRTFLLGLLLIPFIIGGIIFFGERLSRRGGGPREPVRVGMTGTSETLGIVEAAFNEHNESRSESPIHLDRIETDGGPADVQGKERLRRAQIDAYVVLEGDAESKDDAIQFYTYKPDSSKIDALWSVERLIRDAVVSRRYEVHGFDETVLKEIARVPIHRIELGDAEGEERVQGEGQRAARMMAPFAFMYLIFLGIVGMGQHMLSSIIEEKNSRIIEVLLSVVSPFELMAGKILGLAGVGLTVMALWGVAAYMAADWQGIDVEIGGDLLACALVYYILGFILFSAILAGIGSICNTIKETQSLMMPVMLLFIIPLLSWMQLVRSPNGQFARVLSYIPPATPMVMVLRLSSGADIWFGEVVASVLVLALGVIVMLWLASKVFRTGILMYGKRPGPREILRWLGEK